MYQNKDVTTHVEEAEHGASSENPLPEQKKTKVMTLFSLYIGIAAWIYNFDLGYSGIVLQMPPYNQAFGICVSKPNAAGIMVQKCAVTALQQSLISLTLLFIALGGALSGITGTYIGRRGTIQVGCVLIAIGAGGMLGTTGNFTGYMAAKCIGGVGLGHIMATATAYGVECTAPDKRGMLLSLFNFGLGMGNAVSAAVCLGTSTYTTNLAWQIPIICQIPLAFILGLGAMLFPESPRWLLVKGREEAARKSFARFYNKDPQSFEISKQVQEVQYYIEMEKAEGATTKWTDIFRGTNLKRTFTSVFIAVSTGITGSKFIAIYSTIFLAGVGIGNPYLISLIVALCAWAGAFPGPFIIEYGGRRLSLLIGYGLMALFILTVAAVGTGLGPNSPTAKTVLIVFLCLWAATYGAFVGTSIAITAPEMHAVRLRTYGQAFTTTIFEIFSFGASFYTPYMLSAQYGNMGLNVGYFYFGLTAIVWVLVLLFVPETARLSLEQIDDHFLSGRKAWRTSIKRNKIIARGQSLNEKTI